MPGFDPATHAYGNVGADPTVPPAITATAADGGVVSITPPTSVPGSATITVTDGDATTAYTVALVPTSTSAAGTVSGTVPPTLALTLGPPAQFGAFTPGVDRTYEASTTATVTSTAGHAALTADGGRLSNGAFTLSTTTP